MRFEDEDLAKMAQVNALMKNINGKVDNIYEALMDDEHEELLRHIQALATILRKLTKKYKD